MRMHVRDITLIHIKERERKNMLDEELRKKPVSLATLRQEEAKEDPKKTEKKEEDTSVFTSKRVKDDSYYQDSNNLSSKKSLCTLADSSLFAGEGMKDYMDRMTNAIDHIDQNEKWRISMDVNGDGTPDDVKLTDAIRQCGDSELDLYVQAKVDEVMKKYGHCSKGYLSEDAIADLKAAGIRVDSVGASDGTNTNRAYAFTLVDEEGNVLQDENGKAGNYIMADCLIPDGYAQGAERELVSILDTMGEDLISKADFVGRESDYYDVVAQVEANIQSGAYESGGSIDTLYGNIKDAQEAVKQLWGGHGSAPGATSSSSGNTVEGDPLGDELVNPEEAANTNAAQSAYEARLETAIAEYKAMNGKDPIGNDLAQIQTQVKSQVASYYGTDVIDQLDI